MRWARIKSIWHEKSLVSPVNWLELLEAIFADTRRSKMSLEFQFWKQQPLGYSLTEVQCGI